MTVTSPTTHQTFTFTSKLYCKRFGKSNLTVDSTELDDPTARSAHIKYEDMGRPKSKRRDFSPIIMAAKGPITDIHYFVLKTDD